MSVKILSGIYAIRNVVNGRVYVGAAVNIAKRLYQHRWHLTRGSHPSRHLQAAWRKYGEEAFSFEIVEAVEHKDLIPREQAYLNDAYSAGRPYNLCRTAGSTLGLPGGMKGRRHSEAALAKMSATAKARGPKSAETRAKMSAANKGKIMSAEARAKIGAASRGNTHNLGRKHSPETRAKVAAALRGNTRTKGRALSKEHRAKISAAGLGNTNSLGYKHTEETRAKRSAAKKGRPHSEAHRASMRAAWKRRAPISAETRAKMLASRKTNYARKSK